MGRQYVIGDTGYTFITAEWVPDPDRIAQALVQFSEAIDDWAEPLAASSVVVRQNIDKRFQTETDPYDVPWKELNEGYAAWKAEHGGAGILELTGDMRKAATSGSITVEPLEKGIFFNASGMPFYAGWHQTGLPDRASPLPQRMFIGIDDEGAAEIAAIFTEWLTWEWEEYWHSFSVGETVTTSKGARGTFTNIPAYQPGGGPSSTFSVRGFVGGHFVPGVVQAGEWQGYRARAYHNR